MKNDFTELNSEDDLNFNNSKELIGPYHEKYLNTKEHTTRDNSSHVTQRIAEPKKKLSDRQHYDAQKSKQLNHRQRSKQRYTAMGPSRLQPVLGMQSPSSNKHIIYQDELIQSPLKIKHIPTQKTDNQDISILHVNQEPILQVSPETIQIKEAKTSAGENESKHSSALNESKHERMIEDRKGIKGMKKIESLKEQKKEERKQQREEDRNKRHSNIINEARLPRVPNKKFDTLEKIYGTSQHKKVQPRRGDSSSTRPSYAKPREDREVRRLRLDRAKQLLSGKVSIIWIYCISTQIDEDLKDRIYEVYKGLLNDQNVVPYVKQAWEIQPFLQLPNTYFKIVTNLENADKALGYKINVKVVQYYIYNDEGQKGLSRALQYKNWTKKVKGIYSNIERIIEKTEEQIDDTIQIYRFNNGLEHSVKQAKFPSFLKLSGKDKTEATLYRGNLYGSVKIDQKDKEIAYSNFMALVRQKYGNSQKEQKNIMDYSRLKHLVLIKTKQQAEKVVKFYVRESFYYQVLNSMLRTLKSTEQFKPCILPFNETYHSVKIFYNEYVKQHNRKIPAMELYRGAKLKTRDFKSLEPGVFIEMYGFMSTSKSLESAKKFTDKDGYIFVIHVREMDIPVKWDKYDHGFVDINANKLATGAFEKEEQILFNALNIFKVSKVERKGPYIYIHLQYGAIFSLLAKAKEMLTPDEKDVLINYQYCTRLMGDIEDQGDVHLLSSQFDEAKDYYIDRINKNESDAKNYYKLANVQKECGQIDEAEKNGQISLQLMTEQFDKNDRETCLKVFSIHSKNAEINIQKEDYLNADEVLTQGIQLLDDSEIFLKAKKIRERGEIKFKKGEIKDAEKDFDLSEKMFMDIEKQGQNKKWDVQKKYILSILTLWCSDMTKDEVEQQKQKQLSEIDSLEKQIASMRDDIEDELFKVNKSLKDVAIYVEDKDKYEYCVKRGRALLLSVAERQTNDPLVKAKLKVMEATIQDYLDLVQSEKLLNDAIALVESETPFDPAVGDYATILAKLQKKQLEKFINPEGGMKLDPNNRLQYNAAEQKAIYGRCRNNFQKAINVLLYNNKTKDSPEVVGLKNQIGELDFNCNNYQSCEQIIKEVKDSTSQMQHTQISKTSLLLSKIAFARGQLKLSFKTLNDSDNMLKKVIIKSTENPKYQAMYEKNDIYLEIVLIRSKVYHKQLHHDMSLKELDMLEAKVLVKMEGYESHSLLSSVYEQIAEVHAGTGQKKFLEYFEKAISLREKQMGKYNIHNAVSYCNFAKYLMLLNELKPAAQNLSKAVEIFACLSNDHPINWVVHFANGIFCEQQNSFDEASKLFRSCLDMAVKKFDPSHITIKKVRLRIAKSLLKLGSLDESFSQLQQLEEEVDDDLKESRIKIDVSQETDDEKITLEKIILTELKNLIMREENNLRFSQVQVQKYKEKYDNLRATFRLDGLQKQ